MAADQAAADPVLPAFSNCGFSFGSSGSRCQAILSGGDVRCRAPASPLCSLDSTRVVELWSCRVREWRHRLNVMLQTILAKPSSQRSPAPPPGEPRVGRVVPRSKFQRHPRHPRHPRPRQEEEQGRQLRAAVRKPQLTEVDAERQNRSNAEHAILFEAMNLMIHLEERTERFFSSSDPVRPGHRRPRDDAHGRGPPGDLSILDGPQHQAKPVLLEISSE